MDKNELQTKLVQLEYINQQIRAMEMSLSEVSKAVDELSVLKVGLKNLESASKGDELLLPLGASSYAFANLNETDTVLVSIGAGVFVRKKIGDAMPIIDRQVEEMKKQEEILVQNISILGQESEILSQEVSVGMQAEQSV
jgi:prefoldin alpha subunit